MCIFKKWRYYRLFRFELLKTLYLCINNKDAPVFVNQHIAGEKIPCLVFSVCASAFVRDTGLTELVMPNSVTTMGNGAFSGCTGLTAVTLSNALAALPNFAFMGCTALPTLTLPASVGRIGTMAFRNCTALDTLVVKATVPPSTNSMSFRNIPDSCLLIVPCGALEAYTEAWSNYFSQIVEDCGSQGIDDIATSDIKAYARDGRIVVEGADGQQVFVFNLMGRTIRNEALPTGIYMVKVGNYPARKVAVVR